MRRSVVSLALASAVMASLPALSEETAAFSEGAAPTFQEVERGGYAGTSFGFALTTVPGASGQLATGSVLEVELGYDIGSLFGIGLFVWGASMTTPGSAALASGTPIGDFSSVFPGAELKLYLPIASDGNGVKRLFFDVRAGAGVMIFEGGDSADGTFSGISPVCVISPSVSVSRSSLLHPEAR
jgi:hypothetical protein